MGVVTDRLIYDRRNFNFKFSEARTSDFRALSV